jgi:hypothetical protein
VAVSGNVSFRDQKCCQRAQPVNQLNATRLSGGLAMVAGFCSVLPQVIWIVLSGWCLTLPESAALPAFNQLLIIVGVLLAIAMFVYQVWRVRTDQFTPTIREFIVDPFE